MLLIAFSRIRVPAFIEFAGEFIARIIEQFWYENSQDIKNFGSFLKNIPEFRKLNDEEIEPFRKSITQYLENSRELEISRGEVFKNKFIWVYLDWLTNQLVKLNWTLFKTDESNPFFTSDNPVCSHLPPDEAINTDLFEEFLNLKIRISFPLTKEYCLVIHHTPNAPAICNVENWLESLNQQRAKGAFNYIYASISDQSILNHGIKYVNVNPYEITSSISAFVPAKIVISRVR